MKSQKVLAAECIAEIQGAVAAALNMANDPVTPKDVDVNKDTILEMFSKCFRDGVKSKIFILHEDSNNLIQFVSKEAIEHLQGIFEHPVANSADLLATINGRELSVGARNAQIKAVMIEPWRAVLRSISINSQRPRTMTCTDIFADSPSIEFDPPDYPNSIQVNFIHKDLVRPAGVSDELVEKVIADFRKHFPAFDDFNGAMVAGRFAVDRKLAYYFLRWVSDAGKGLMIGAWENLGLVVRVPQEEAKKALKSQPSALNEADFRTAWIIFFDEFHGFFSEVKVIQSSMIISPKNLFRVIVKVYNKVFASAEGNEAMVGELGAEKQVVNRFNVHENEKLITESKLFKKIGDSKYVNAMSAYIADFVNGQVAEYRKLGRAGAEKAAAEVLKKHHKKYGIGKLGQLSDKAEELADDFGAWIIKIRKYSLERKEWFDGAPGAPSRSDYDMVIDNILVGNNPAEGTLYLLRPTIVFDYWAKKIANHRESVKPGLIKKEVIAQLSADEKGACTRKPYAKVNKAKHCVQLKPKYGEIPAAESDEQDGANAGSGLNQDQAEKGSVITGTGDGPEGTLH
jgi:hypothetical protein